MAGGKGRLLEGLGLHLAPKREEERRESPWRRQHARASPVPATTPRFSRVVTSASGKMRMWQAGGTKRSAGSTTLYEDRRTVREKEMRGRGMRKEKGGGGGSGRDTAGSEGSYLSCFWTSHGAHCPECPLFSGCQQTLNSVRIGFPFRRHPPPKQRQAERVAAECD